MSCVICGGDLFFEFKKRDSKSSKELNIAFCNGCGLIFQNPLPSSKELEEYYSHNYRSEYKNTYTPKPKHIHRAGKTAIKRISFLKENGIDSGRLVDIGAGGGEFVYMASAFGFESEGIEPNIGYSEYAKQNYQKSIKTGTLEDVGSGYDVITMFHVLEHIPNLPDVFERLYTALNPNGVLFIEVPWIETKDASPSNIYFGAHLFYFSSATPIAAASRYFDPIKVDTSSNLKVLLRAKKHPGSIKLPDPKIVDDLKVRLEKKGWLEYLFKGGGILKPLKKLRRAAEESKSKNLTPKEILENIIKKSTIE